jgi:hypothetical protein
MPNAIKYSTSAQTLALKKGNFWIGTGDVGKGPSDTTGYYNGITPAAGGYTVYLNKSGAPGDLSYGSISNDAGLISYTNGIAGTSYTTAAECLTYFAGQNDRICFNRDYEGIVTDGIVLNSDAGFAPSYPQSGTTWYNVAGTQSGTGTLTNGPTYSSSDGGCIVYDGTDDFVVINANNGFQPSSELTLEVWFKSLGSNSRTQGLLYINYGTGLRLTNLGNIHIRINSSGSLQQFTTSTTYFNNQWNQALLTINSNTAKLYVNSSFVVQYSITYDGNSPFNTSIGGIGTDINDGVNRGFYGSIAIARVYNRVLSDSEISQNYNAQKGRFGL